MRSPLAAPAVAAGLIATGVAFLLLGWKGAAATLFIPTQVAFGVSGSIAGIAVLGVGLTVFAVHTTRLHTAQRTRDLQRLLSVSVELLAAVRRRSGGASAPTAAAVSSNGHGAGLPGGASRDAVVAAPNEAPDVLVVPGAKIFHAADCRVLGGNERALHLTVEEADAAGLRGCRICGAANS